MKYEISQDLLLKDGLRLFQDLSAEEEETQ